MILLLCALAVLIGGYFGVQQFNKTESVSETSGTFDLTAKAIGDLTGISWTKDDTAFSFAYGDGTWVTTDQPAWPVQQSSVQDMAEALLGLQATRKLEDVKSLADYGLETPAFSVTASWKDGSRTTYSMGDATPFADGYYLNLSGQDGTIYTIASSLADTFSKTRKDLVALEALPVVSEASGLSAGSAFEVTKKEASTTVDPDQLWYDARTGAPLDGSRIEELVSAIQGMKWKELVTAAADAESLREWQLEDGQAIAVTLSGGEESRTVLFGAQNEDGDYYARLPDSAMVYTVEKSSVSGLLAATAENLRISSLLPMPYEQLATAAFTTEKGAYQLVKPAAETAEAAAAEGETEKDTESSSATDEAERNLWKQVTALKAAGKPETEQAGDRVLEIHAVSTSGLETTVVFSEYSAESYQAVVDEGTPQLVSADDVDSLVRTVRTMP